MRLLIAVTALVLCSCSGAGEEQTSVRADAPAAPVEQPTTPPSVHQNTERPGLAHPARHGSTIHLAQVPDWYNGDRPWKDLSEAARRDLWAKRLAYEEITTEATKPAAGGGEGSSDAAAGEAVLHRVVDEYNLDPYFRNADTFGRRMVIWLPEAAWRKLSTSDKQALEDYMASKYANWGIGVGRQQGREVLFDRLVVER